MTYYGKIFIQNHVGFQKRHIFVNMWLLVTPLLKGHNKDKTRVK